MVDKTGPDHACLVPVTASMPSRLSAPFLARSVVRIVPKPTDPPPDERVHDTDALPPEALPPEIVDAISRALSEHREIDPTISVETYLNIIEIEIERLQCMLQVSNIDNKENVKLKRDVLRNIMLHLRSRKRVDDI